MDSTHGRYEQLAVGHVLGGLPARDAADFRSHLLDCTDCRSRVAELRDIAADLAAAEREERAEAQLRTEVPTRTVEDGPAPDDVRGPAVTSRHIGLGAVVIVLLAGVLAFWNLHLRTQVATVTSVVEVQDQALTVLATGIPVATELAGSIRGTVAVDDDTVAFTLTGLPALVGNEQVVVWLVGGSDGDEPARLARAEDGHLAGSLPRGDAAELVLTVETPDLQRTSPAGRELVRADLDAAIP